MKKQVKISEIKQWWEDFQRLSYVDARWITVWSLIYVSFLLLDVVVPQFWGSSLLKYVGVFLCVIYAYQKYNKDSRLIIALLFTFLADTILVWTNHYTIGVFVFCFAQYMHFIRLATISRKSLIVFSIILSALVIINGLDGKPIVYPLAVIYGFLLICNYIMARQRYKEESGNFKHRCARYGFLAFICCDICVALRFLMLTGTFRPFLVPLISYLVWFFYYPSQVLLANSSVYKGHRKSQKVAKTHPIS